ncbi:MAG: hypothetical protein U0636_01370 [Phycisphaerales bacterium]
MVTRPLFFGMQQRGSAHLEQRPITHITLNGIHHPARQHCHWPTDAIRNAHAAATLDLAIELNAPVGHRARAWMCLCYARSISLYDKDITMAIDKCQRAHLDATVELLG